MNLYLSVRENAKSLTREVMQAGISGNNAKDILAKAESVIEDALVKAEKYGAVKAAMAAKEAVEKGEDLMDVIAEMITSNNS